MPYLTRYHADSETSWCSQLTTDLYGYHFRGCWEITLTKREAFNSSLDVVFLQRQYLHWLYRHCSYVNVLLHS